MHIGEKLDALQAELAAKSSRIADLEARVSLLETENARLRKKFMPEGDAMDRTGGRVVNDAMEIGDGDGEGGSGDKVEIMDAYGGHHGSVRCDANVGLDDDDVSITPRGKKRAAARVISDSESGEEGDGESGKEDENDGGNGDREVGVASSRKRALRGVTNSESEEEEDGEPYEMEGCSTPAPRRSARLVKNQSKRTPPARRELEFEEPQDQEETESGSESEGYNTDEFIDDEDCSHNPPDPAEEYSAELEECDSDENLNYGEIIDRIRGKKKDANNNDWESEAKMLPAFDVDPELTLKAICAIYRQQTEDEQAERATIVHNRRGFSQIDAPRGSRIAQFLLDGDASGPLKKTAQDLNKSDREFCHKMAFRYSKQLFEIYQNKEDPYFP